jgi:hypothetical protein
LRIDTDLNAKIEAYQPQTDDKGNFIKDQDGKIKLDLDENGEKKLTKYEYRVSYQFQLEELNALATAAQNQNPDFFFQIDEVESVPWYLEMLPQLLISVGGIFLMYFLFLRPMMGGAGKANGFGKAKAKVIHNDKDAVKFAADGNSVFNYDGATNALVTDFNGTKYYIGTYSTYTTLSASKFSYINAENTGVSQFPVELVAVGGSVTPEDPTDPEDPTNPENPGDTPTVPVDPPASEDVVTTYVGTDSFGGQFLTVVINETKKTVTYTYAHPMMGTTTVIYNYTVAEDGTVSLTKEDGTAVVALEASLTFTEGVPTAAAYNGTDYTLSVNGESEELTEKDLLGDYVIGENEALIIYDE